MNLNGIKKNKNTKNKEEKANKNEKYSNTCRQPKIKLKCVKCNRWKVVK